MEVDDFSVIYTYNCIYSAAQARYPERCRNMICKYSNTSLFLDKTSMKLMFLDLISNEV